MREFIEAIGLFSIVILLFITPTLILESLLQPIHPPQTYAIFITGGILGIFLVDFFVKILESDFLYGLKPVASRGGLELLAHCSVTELLSPILGIGDYLLSPLPKVGLTQLFNVAEADDIGSWSGRYLKMLNDVKVTQFIQQVNLLVFLLYNDKNQEVI